ncbi:2-aminomuconate deaminase [Ruegeria denitrificans]|uniref:2-aminomuconate deaminase n=1 Tax=Ruegeria denitrificans TaxID=1715692 RepID=A0A0P1IJ58_9RHOB|nr:RidA family protein [Ruegeria denitrificans]CUJ98606.1 2-aminomuconate deaminase [Ruegeria denitrificans]
MSRRYSFPEEHWDWPVKLTHHHAVRAGDMVFTGGQVDLDSQGTVRNTGDLDAQVRNSMAYMQDLLTDLGVGFTDLVRLVVYYVGDAGDEVRLLNLLADIIGHEVKPVVNLINLPELCYPDMLCEIEGVAMRAPNGSALPRQNYHIDAQSPLPRAFSHVVKCNDMIFTGDMTARSSDGSVIHPGDIVAQTRLMMERLSHALQTAGAGMQDVVKVNTFYLGDGTAEDWEVSARIRADYFPEPGPAPTGIPVPSFPHDGLTTRIAATACVPRARRIRHAWPDGHWNWTTALPYKHGVCSGQLIHVGGQVALDTQAKVLEPGNMVTQTRIAMENVVRVLDEFGATLNDVIKVTTFYQGSASAEALHENLLIRSNSYTAPGPATTGIPVPNLVYEDMVIEIEVIAMLENHMGA